MFPDPLANIPSLNSIVFNNVNTISSWNVTSLSTMSSLINLIFSNCSITTIPTEIGLLSNLQSLVLHDPLLPTPLPTEISLLRNLQNLYNYVQQPLFTEIGLLSNLNNLILNPTPNSQLPTELGQLSNLGNLIIVKNSQMGGTLPPQLAPIPLASISLK